MLKYADEGFSGELLERPALNRLREGASKGLISKSFVTILTDFLGEFIIDDKKCF
ncbi:hypothetical protein AAHT65_20295 [Bacillus atrophaeus]|nr:hypothetical protein [Bacillus atrophaeus]